MKRLKLGIVSILVFGFLSAPVTQVYAIQTVTENSEELLEDYLEEENLELVDTEINLETEEYKIEVINDAGDTVELGFELGSTEINGEVASNTGELESYTIELDSDMELSTENLDEAITDITVTNDDTGNVYEGDELEGSLSLAIPLGIPLFWTALVALFKAGCVAIIAGATYIVGTQVITKIKNNKKKKNHYFAAIVKGKLFIGPGTTEDKAVAQLKRGKSTWSVTSNLAKKIAGRLSKGSAFSEVDKDRNGRPKKGYYYHYHSANRKPAGHHAFYGYPV